MSKIILTSIIIFLSTCILHAKEKPKVFSIEEFYGEYNYRVALTKAFPGLETCFYHFDARFTIGAFREPNKGRILIFLPPGGIKDGKVRIEINGKRLREHQTESVDVLVDYENGGKPEKLNLGIWTKHKPTETITIKAVIGRPHECSYTASYHPDTGWMSQPSPVIIEAKNITEADAYHFTEGSLLKDVRAVLKKKKSCRVKLQQNQILTISPWKEDKEAEFFPMIIKVAKKFSVNEKEAEEVLINKFQLENRLDAYCAAVKAGAEIPKIRLRVTPDADDSLFRQALNSIKRCHIQNIQLEEVAK